MILGTICASLMGAALPGFTVIWGGMIDSFGELGTDTAKTMMLNFIYLGLGSFITGWGMYACWMIAGERQGITCRK